MRILVVDDDAASQRRCRAMLEGEGFEVHCEASLGSARRYLRQQRVEAVLLDLFLPDGSGYDLMRLNADLLGAAPVVGMTGVYRGSACARLLEVRYPFATVLPKPLELDDLREVLRERLGALYPTSTGPSTGGQAQAAAVVGDEVQRDLADHVAHLVGPEAHAHPLGRDLGGADDEAAEALEEGAGAGLVAVDDPGQEGRVVQGTHFGRAGLGDAPGAHGLGRRQRGARLGGSAET